MATDDVKKLQRDLNKFTEKHLDGVAPLMVDGKRGHATNRRIVTAKYYLGYDGDSQRTNRLSPQARKRLGRPDSGEGATARRGDERRRELRAGVKKRTPKGVAKFDGRPIAAWLKPYLEYARKNGWKGTVVSGWRDPEFSEQLCISMCGKPACPGRCAGRKSNHGGVDKPSGAVDVSDYARFAKLMESCPLEPRIFNGMADRDPVHFSASGR
jgi:hypothetical protein